MENKKISVIFDGAAAVRALPARPAESNKGTFGRVLCVCGSKGMSGAAFLAAKAAYRVGAGLVQILTVEENRAILQGQLPEAIVTVYDPEAPDLDLLRSLGERADALVIGPGLGISPASRRLVSFFLRYVKKPTVLDADGLNLLSANPSLLKHARGAILTPHPMEMSRLLGCSVEEVLADPQSVALEYAGAHGVTVVMKGHCTAVTDGGETLYLNRTGNSGMATGGSGDVLAGMIGGLLAYRGELSSLTVASAGVYLHGLAGDLAAARLSEHSVMAGDILESVPEAIRRTLGK